MNNGDTIELIMTFGIGGWSTSMLAEHLDSIVICEVNKTCATIGKEEMDRYLNDQLSGFADHVLTIPTDKNR